MKKIIILIGLLLSFDRYNAQNSTITYTQTSKEDEFFQEILEMGKDWNKPNSRYNTNNIHNQFDFTLNPLAVSDQNFIEASKINFKFEEETLDYFIKGGDSLVVLLKNTDEELSNFKIYIESYYRYYQKFSEIFKKKRRLFVSSDFKNFDNIKEMGFEYRDSININYMVIPYESSKKLEKKLQKKIERNEVTSLTSDNLSQYLLKTFNISKEQLELNEYQKELIELKKYYSNFFKRLAKGISDDYNYNISFVGYTLNGKPNGFGLLLNPNKQIISYGYWNDGFPALIYSLNTYHNKLADNDSYKHVMKRKGDKYYMIKFDTKELKDKEIKSFNIYIGECDNNEGKFGYGNCFYEHHNKDSLVYYQGYWNRGKKHGKGVLFNAGYKYDGEWIDGSISSGTLIWPDNKTRYIGAFLDSKMHGMGKKIDADGKIFEGLFENDLFVKSKEQLEKERLEREETEKRLAAIALEEKYKKYVNEGDNFMKDNKYQSAVNSYKQAIDLNFKKDEVLLSKYANAFKIYDQWKKENEYYICSWCNKKDYKNNNGDYIAHYHYGKISSCGNGEAYSYPLRGDNISKFGPYCSDKCCWAARDNWKQDQWKNYGIRIR
jgi:hypothetical protein